MLPGRLSIQYIEHMYDALISFSSPFLATNYEISKIMCFEFGFLVLIPQ